MQSKQINLGTIYIAIIYLPANENHRNQYPLERTRWKQSQPDTHTHQSQSAGIASTLTWNASQVATLRMVFAWPCASPSIWSRKQHQKNNNFPCIHLGKEGQPWQFSLKIIHNACWIASQKQEHAFASFCWIDLQSAYQQPHRITSIFKLSQGFWRPSLA